MKNQKRNRKGKFRKSWSNRIILTIGILYLGGMTWAVTQTGETNIVKGLDGEANIIYVNNAQAAKPYSEMNLQDKIAFYAAEYGINETDFKNTIWCESHDQDIQSSAYRNGKRENSWGILQIDLDYHPSITKAEALDEDWSLEWASRNWFTVTWYAYQRSTGLCADGSTPQ